jgi:hypothetical protein
MAVKRYNGSGWDTVAGLGAQGAAATSSTIATWVKTASGGETTLSGNDDNSVSLSYTAGQELLYINGVLQKRAVDYVASTGTTITGLNALVAGDVVTVWTVNAFSVTNAIPNSTITAKGNLIVGTGTGTYTAQTVGTDGQVLTANSAQADGVEWVTPSSMTLISTTTLSGTSTSITVPANTYKDLVAYIYGVNPNGTAALTLRINGITTGVYQETMTFGQENGVVAHNVNNYTAMNLSVSGAQAVQTAVTTNVWVLTFRDANSTVRKLIATNGNYVNSANNNVTTIQTDVVSTATSAITNITVISTQSLTAGTVQLYGVK